MKEGIPVVWNSAHGEHKAHWGKTGLSPGPSFITEQIRAGYLPLNASFSSYCDLTQSLWGLGIHSLKKDLLGTHSTMAHTLTSKHNSCSRNNRSCYCGCRNYRRAVRVSIY